MLLFVFISFTEKENLLEVRKREERGERRRVEEGEVRETGEGREGEEGREREKDWGKSNLQGLRPY